MIELDRISKNPSVRAITKENMLKIAIGVIDTVIEKNKLYGDSLFMLGEKGLFSRIYDKVNRLKFLVWDKEKREYADDERIAIANAVFDIFEYMIGWMCLFIDEETIEYLESDVL